MYLGLGSLREKWLRINDWS